MKKSSIVAALVVWGLWASVGAGGVFAAEPAPESAAGGPADGGAEALARAVRNSLGAVAGITEEMITALVSIFQNDVAPSDHARRLAELRDGGLSDIQELIGRHQGQAQTPP
ncbi:MAG: hypothetical protein HY059_09530 [Proteobacteria bacterium]|nr:hypothetical protein [Pseudomonadota bacterium]